MENIKVKLFNIISDDLEEFADLVGKSGKLIQTVDGLTFCPNQSGDFLTMPTESKFGPSYHEGDEIIIKTKLGNTFKFRVIS